jgi:hypothetical protein
MFGSWSHKCSECANYSGSQQSAGFCRVWGTLVTTGSALPRQCPHWTSREALKEEARALTCTARA